MPERTGAEDVHNKGDFEQLRKKVHQGCESALKKRVHENPTPTETETLMGAFAEEIEEQVRDAVLGFYKKGYATESSGFGGEYGEAQQIDGFFLLDDDTTQKLKNIGVTVLRGRETGFRYQEYTMVSFRPARANAEEIKQKWAEVVKILPQRREPAPPAISGPSAEFRQKFAPKRTDIEKNYLERALRLKEFRPDLEAAMRARLKQLGHS